jgi:glycosyltransferase involved in cell wall biosynthesis
MIAEGLKEKDFEVIVIFGHDGPLIERFRNSGIKTHIIVHKSWLRRKDAIRFWKDFFIESAKSKNFISFFKKERPDLVYINTSVSLSAAIAAKFCRVPVIWHIRELTFLSGGELFFPLILKNAIRFIFNLLSNRLVVNSKSVNSEVLGNKYPFKTTVVYNAINEIPDYKPENSVLFRKKYAIPESKKIIIGVPGTLRPMKGHTFLFDTIAEYFKEADHIAWIITGDGEDNFKSRLKSQVRSLGISHLVVFTGNINDMNQFYQACDFHIVPSKSEPFGRTVIEAMANKKLVIATRVGGIKEIIEPNENGILIDYGANTDLKEAIKFTLSNPDFKKKIIEKAFQEIKLRFTKEKYSETIINLFRDQKVYN